MTTDSSDTNQKNSDKLPVRAARTTKSTSAASSGSSVYDRLYSSSTASSKIRKQTGPAVRKNILMREEDDTANNNIKSRPTRRTRPSTQSSSNGPVFSRLYEKGTASSVSKRKASTYDPAPSAHTIAKRAMKPKNQTA